MRRAARLTRFGYDALAYARLAAGHLDLVIENKLHRHDWAALVPVVRGAGGVIGDWQGGSDFEPGSVVAAASRELYDEAVAAASGNQPDLISIELKADGQQGAKHVVAAGAGMKGVKEQPRFAVGADRYRGVAGRRPVGM